MTVLILTAVPPGLRGQLTRWMLEVAPGVFVGQISARIRDALWIRVERHAAGGRALLVYQTVGEQRLAFKSFRHDWDPVDFDGLKLIRRQTH